MTGRASAPPLRSARRGGVLRRAAWWALAVVLAGLGGLGALLGAGLSLIGLCCGGPALAVGGAAAAGAAAGTAPGAPAAAWLLLAAGAVLLAAAAWVSRRQAARCRGSVAGRCGLIVGIQPPTVPVPGRFTVARRRGFRRPGRRGRRPARAALARPCARCCGPAPGWATSRRSPPCPRRAGLHAAGSRCAARPAGEVWRRNTRGRHQPEIALR